MTDYEKPRLLEPTMTKLLPCPFCNHDGIHLRKKTQKRESKLTYEHWSGEYTGYGQYVPLAHCVVIPMTDYRFGVKFYCGKCGASQRYVWGEWHLASKDEAEEYQDMPHRCELFNSEQEHETIEKAIAAWNRRAGECASE